MDKRTEHLATLGCSPDASWEEITLAYKDLMRVWHPDRFQSDDRLRQKAEEQAQRINNAMSELRKMRTNGATQKQPAKPHSTAARPTERPKANPFSDTRAHTQRRRPAHNQNAQAESFHFVIPPLTVRPRFIPSISRVALGLILLYLSYDSLNRTNTNSFNTAFILGIAFFAIDLTIRNTLPVLTRRPVISVERRGLFFVTAGWVNWIDIETVWPVMTPRASQLRIFFSQHYLSKKDLLTRLWLKLLRFWNTPHLVIPFGALAALPTDIVGSMRLRQHHNDVEIRDLPVERSWLLSITRMLSAASISAPILRCALGHPPSLEQALPYLAIFLVSHSISFYLKLRRSTLTDSA